MVISTLQLPLMMVIITRLICNTGLILRLLDNPTCWHGAPAPAAPSNKGHVQARGEQQPSPHGGVLAAGWQPMRERVPDEG